MSPGLRIVSATILGLAVAKLCTAAQVVGSLPATFPTGVTSYDETVLFPVSPTAPVFYTVGCPPEDAGAIDCNDPARIETPPLLGLTGVPIARAPVLLRSNPSTATTHANSLDGSEIASIAGLIVSFCLVGASLRRPAARLA